MAKIVVMASESTVSLYENRMTNLILEAEKVGVVLEVKLEPKAPLMMGNYTMVACARAAVTYEDD
jgi:hypothetical protein